MGWILGMRTTLSNVLLLVIDFFDGGGCGLVVDCGYSLFLLLRVFSAIFYCPFSFARDIIRSCSCTRYCSKKWEVAVGWKICVTSCCVQAIYIWKLIQEPNGLMLDHCHHIYFHVL